MGLGRAGRCSAPPCPKELSPVPPTLSPLGPAGPGLSCGQGNEEEALGMRKRGTPTPPHSPQTHRDPVLAGQPRLPPGSGFPWEPNGAERPRGARLTWLALPRGDGEGQPQAGTSGGSPRSPRCPKQLPSPWGGHSPPPGHPAPTLAPFGPRPPGGPCGMKAGAGAVGWARCSSAHPKPTFPKPLGFCGVGPSPQSPSRAGLGSQPRYGQAAPAPSQETWL